MTQEDREHIMHSNQCSLSVQAAQRVLEALFGPASRWPTRRLPPAETLAEAVNVELQGKG